MKTWEVNSPDGQHWQVDAPDGVSEDEVIAFSQEHAASWRNGGHYAMEPAGEQPSLAEQTGATPPPTRAQQADLAVAKLNKQISDVEDARRALKSGRFMNPGRAMLLGGTGTEMGKDEINQKAAELDALHKQLSDQRDALQLGTTGQTVGGMGGALAGGGAGAVLGSALGGPFAPVTGAIGGILGSILGAAGGVYAGTRLWDVPQVQEARDISDQEAAQLARSRAVDSLIWDGAFALLLGPGGRVIGKLAQGSRLVPALKATAREAISWDAIKNAKKAQLEGVAAKRAAVAPSGISTQASEALGVQPPVAGAEATKNLVSDLAERTGGRIPTQSEMTGRLSGGEQFVRSQAPAAFTHNDQILADTAENIRKGALSALDQAGAYQGTDLGTAIRAVRDSADATLRRTTAPIFERAAQQNVAVDMHDPLQYLNTVLRRDQLSANSLLAPGERQHLTALRDAIQESPFMPPQGVQDLISGQKESLRRLADETQPSSFMKKVLGDLTGKADSAYLSSLGTVKDDPALVKDLLAARKLYGATRTDMYSDTMASLARKNPEDVGRYLTGKGTITEIQDLRNALDRAYENAPAKSRLKSGQIVEMGKPAIQQEKQRIDAGLVKGFIEKNTQSLGGLESKLRDPDFRATLKELLVGNGAANPALNKQVLNELDRTLGYMKLIRPERAPQPGRMGILPGVGGIGAGTVGGAVTGGNIQTAVIGAIGFITGARAVSRAVATAMTTGDMGMLRAIQRATQLAPEAGKNVAAAETILAIARQLGMEQGAQ